MSGGDVPHRADRALAQAISRLAYCNPFLPERIECERAALGAGFVTGGTLWHATGEPGRMPNVEALGKLSEALAGRLAARLTDGVKPTADDLQLYEDVVVYVLFSRYEDQLYHLIEAPRPRQPPSAPTGSSVRTSSDCCRVLGPR